MSPGYDPENLHDDACGIDWVLRLSGLVLNLKRPRPLTELSWTAFGDTAGLLEKPVDEGGLPMVDMGDDGDIAKLHGIRNVQRGPDGPAVHMTAV